MDGKESLPTDGSEEVKAIQGEMLVITGHHPQPLSVGGRDCRKMFFQPL